MLAQPSADTSHAVNGEAVRLIQLRGGLGAVPGVLMSGVHAGIKKRKSDLALIALPGPHVCAQVITTNEIKAAPLLSTAAHLDIDGDAIEAIVCNAGCANACTGERGLRDAENTARHTATLLAIRATQVVVASTGVIGVTLPMDRLAKGLDRAHKQLSEGPEASYAAAEAIMTTDHVPKLAAYAWHENGERRVIGGIAKGSGMIAPNMATMLAFLVTDAAVSRDSLTEALREASDGTFNMISVDGDMSTNDAVYCCAKPGDGDATPGLRAALAAVCRDLAIGMVKDGEGATKTLTFTVTGARDTQQARAVGRAVINSSLVKTALYGEDPNWGRMIAAAGSVASGHGSGHMVALPRRPNLGGTRRDRGDERSRSAPRPRRAQRGGAPGPRHRRSNGHRLGLRPHGRLRANQCPLPDVTR